MLLDVYVEVCIYHLIQNAHSFLVNNCAGVLQPDRTYVYLHIDHTKHLLYMCGYMWVCVQVCLSLKSIWLHENTPSFPPVYVKVCLSLLDRRATGDMATLCRDFNVQVGTLSKV